MVLKACAIPGIILPLWSRQEFRLPPIPPSVAPEGHFAPWKGRELWLEIGLCGEVLTLTQEGCVAAPLPFPDPNRDGFSDPKLHCHYTIETKEKSAGFTLWRNREDIEELLEEAETLGVTTAVGLFQELHRLVEPSKPSPSGRVAAGTADGRGLFRPRLRSATFPKGEGF